MKNFGPSPYWSGSQITAGDQASFFQRIEKFVPRRHEDYVFKLTSRIVSSQSWSIPQAAPRGWKVSFKGGWYPAGDGWSRQPGGDAAPEWTADLARGADRRRAELRLRQGDDPQGRADPAQGLPRLNR